MNTNRTPAALILSVLTLSLTSAACGGGSSAMSVEDGVVTEVREVVTEDDLAHLKVTLIYPEAHLQNGAVAALDVRLHVRPASVRDRIVTPVTRSPQPWKPHTVPSRVAVNGVSATLANPETVRQPGLEPPRTLDREAPMQTVRAPEWLKVSLQGEGAERYQVELVRPGAGPDDRVHPGAVDPR